MSESETLKGIVKWFNDAKGFGFIEHTTGKDVFVHYSVIEDDGFKTLKDGEEVSYEIKEGPKGLHAVKVYRSAKRTLKHETDDDSDTGASDDSDGSDGSDSADGSDDEGDLDLVD